MKTLGAGWKTVKLTGADVHKTTTVLELVSVCIGVELSLKPLKGKVSNALWPGKKKIPTETGH